MEVRLSLVNSGLAETMGELIERTDVEINNEMELVTQVTKFLKDNLIKMDLISPVGSSIRGAITRSSLERPLTLVDIHSIKATLVLDRIKLIMAVIDETMPPPQVVLDDEIEWTFLDYTKTQLGCIPTAKSFKTGLDTIVVEVINNFITNEGIMSEDVVGKNSFHASMLHQMSHLTQIGAIIPGQVNYVLEVLKEVGFELVALRSITA